MTLTVHVPDAVDVVHVPVTAVALNVTAETVTVTVVANVCVLNALSRTCTPTFTVDASGYTPFWVRRTAEAEEAARYWILELTEAETGPTEAVSVAVPPTVPS